MSADGWKAVDASLNVLAGRNPTFGVVFKGNFNGAFVGAFGGAFGAIRRHIEGDCLPIVSLKGLVKFELIPNAENRFQKLGVM